MVNSQAFKHCKISKLFYHVQLHHDYFADLCFDTCLYTLYCLINAEISTKKYI
jgi:hypothetical protein